MSSVVEHVVVVPCRFNPSDGDNREVVVENAPEKSRPRNATDESQPPRDEAVVWLLYKLGAEIR
jgi:hypothetical protein